jgi:hypothetical protein
MFNKLLSPLLLSLFLVAGLSAQEVKKAPSIEGTYKLVSRKLPDGKMLSAPDVMGLATYTKTCRNFNVVWKDTADKFFSYSVASTYKLTGSEYTETILFSIMNDEIGGKPINYTLTGPTKTVPVKMHGRRIEFKMPFDPPSISFEGNSMTATAEGVFVDNWERVK